MRPGKIVRDNMGMAQCFDAVWGVYQPANSKALYATSICYKYKHLIPEHTLVHGRSPTAAAYAVFKHLQEEQHETRQRDKTKF